MLPQGTLSILLLDEQMCWKTFDVDQKWDMKMTPLKTIKKKTFVEFAEKMVQQPIDVCERIIKIK